MTKEYRPSWVANNESLSEGLDPSWIRAINKAILRMVVAGKTDQEVKAELWLESFDLAPGALGRGDAYIGPTYGICVWRAQSWAAQGRRPTPHLRRSVASPRDRSGQR